MAETRPSVDTATGRIPATPAFLVGQDGAALGGLFVTDLTQYPTPVPVDVDGADTDILIPGVEGSRHFIFYGWLQPSGDVILTFKSGATDLGPPLFVGDDKVAVVGDWASPIAEHYTGVGEAYSVQKSAAVTLKGRLFKLTVPEPV